MEVTGAWVDETIYFFYIVCAVDDKVNLKFIVLMQESKR